MSIVREKRFAVFFPCLLHLVLGDAFAVVNPGCVVAVTLFCRDDHESVRLREPGMSFDVDIHIYSFSHSFKVGLRIAASAW
jgi:hypothetical protein